MNDKEAVTPGNTGIGNEPEGGREGERKYRNEIFKVYLIYRWYENH